MKLACLVAAGSFALPTDAVKGKARPLPDKIKAVFGANPRFSKDIERESCTKVVSDLGSDSSMKDVWPQLQTITGYLTSGSPTESDGSDQLAAQTFRLLQDRISHADAVEHVERFVKCKVDEEKGHGILQSVVSRGWVDTLAEPVASTLLKGTMNYNPAMALDKGGNNLLHLAVQSGVKEAPEKVVDLATKLMPNATDVYWTLSALAAPNDKGKLPHQLASSGVSRPEDLFPSHLTKFKVGSGENCSAVALDFEKKNNQSNFSPPLTMLATYLKSGACKGSDDGAAIALRRIGEITKVNKETDELVRRMVQCEVDDSTGHTLLQALVAKGWWRALNENFASVLFTGTADYDPIVMQDKNGNNLMHLATRSGRKGLPRKIIQAVSRSLPGCKDVYWTLSALSTPNKDGKLAHELAKFDPAPQRITRYQMLRSHNTAELDKHKPKVVDAAVPHLFNFKRDPHHERCVSVIAELEHDEGTTNVYQTLKLLSLYMTERLHKTPTEIVINDKAAAVALKKVKAQMIGTVGEGVSQDLITHMERLIKCKMDTEKGHTMLQAMIAKGWSKAISQPFSWYLARGTADYDPAMYTDNQGNNLLHLAALSGGDDLPEKLLEFEVRKNFALPDRRMNGVFWILSALSAPNDEGKLPYQVATTGSAVRKFKDLFRFHTDYIDLLMCQAALHKA